MISLAVYIAAQAVSAPNRFVAPIDTMQDVKGDVVYADRKRPFFILIKDGVFYIGHPNREGGRPGEDVAYTWGRPKDCSSEDIKCVELGAHLFICPTRKSRDNASFYKKTAVTVWKESDSGWIGSGVRNAFEPPSESQKYDYRPVMTYNYEVNNEGRVTRIRLTYWRLSGDAPISYDLRLETKQGLQL